MKQYLCVGSYTEPIKFGTGEIFHGKGAGVSICSFADGKIEVLSEKMIRNPSFLCIDETRRKIYAVNELKEYLGEFGGGLTELSYETDGTMTEVQTVNTGGTDPCHVAMDPAGRFLAVSNFASGALSVFPVDEAGSLTGERIVFQHEGSSIHPVRQRGPHAHSAIFTPDGKTMLVPDLGLDMVKAYSCGEDGAAAAPGMDLPAEPGSGPRFGEFSPDGNHFYLINEIGCSLLHCLYEEGRLIPQETTPTLPADFAGDNICSDLHITPDGKFLYASNRGHDSLFCCRIEEDGSLTGFAHVPCGGKTPRNFVIDPAGKYLLAGNQDSDSIVVFAISGDGSLQKQDTFYFGSPVCIRFFTQTVF